MTLNDAINKFVPTYIVKPKEKCPWNNKGLQKMKNEKKKQQKMEVKKLFDAAFVDFNRLNTELYNSCEKMKSSLKYNPS